MFDGDHGTGNDDRVCPLMSLTPRVPYGGDLVGGNYMDCAGERCMWWVSAQDPGYCDCAMHRVATSLRDIAHSLYNLTSGTRYRG